MAAYHARKLKLNIIFLRKGNVEAQLQLLFDRLDDAFPGAQYRRSFFAGECAFEFYSNQSDYLSLIDRALKPSNNLLAPSVKILSTHFGGFGLPPIQWSDPDLDVFALEALLKETPYRLHIDTKYQVYSIFDHSRNYGIQLSSISNRRPPWEAGAPLRIFIHWYLAKIGRPLIHAGSLAINNIGILLAGPGGSGKSSTVISGIFSGLESVGDDYISAEISDRIILRPVFQIMKADPARLSAIGIKTNAELNWQNKVELKFSELPRLQLSNFIEARALCLPKVANQKKTAFLRTSSRQAFLSLTPSAMSQLPGNWDQLFREGAEIARRLPCYTLELGIDPNEIAASITSFIARELR